MDDTTKNDVDKIKEKYKALTRTSAEQPVGHIQSLARDLSLFYLSQKLPIPSEITLIKSPFNKFEKKDYSFDLGIIPPAIQPTILNALDTAHIRYVEIEEEKGSRFLLPLLDIPEDNITAAKLKNFREAIIAATPKRTPAQAVQEESPAALSAPSSEHITAFIDHLRILYTAYGAELAEIQDNGQIINIGKQPPPEVQKMLTRLLGLAEIVPLKSQGNRLFSRDKLTAEKIEKFDSLVDMFVNPPGADFLAAEFDRLASIESNPHPLHLLAMLTRESAMLPNGTSATVSRTLPKFFREEVKLKHDEKTLTLLADALSADPGLRGKELSQAEKLTWLQSILDRDKPKEKTRLTNDMRIWAAAFDITTRNQSPSEVLSSLITVLQATDPNILWPKSRDRLVAAFEALKRTHANPAGKGRTA